MRVVPCEVPAVLDGIGELDLSIVRVDRSLDPDEPRCAGGPVARRTVGVADLERGIGAFDDLDLAGDEHVVVVRGGDFALGMSAPFRLGEDGSATVDVFVGQPDGFCQLPFALSHARAEHTASTSTFEDGSTRVVIAGGLDAGGATLDGVEVLDFLPGQSPALFEDVPLAAPRWGHDASIAENGTVLLAGGLDAEGNARPMELWGIGGAEEIGGDDPRGLGTTVTSFATVWPDANLLVAGGESSPDTFARIRLLLENESSSVTEVSGDLLQAARAHHVAVRERLRDHVLLLGGTDGEPGERIALDRAPQLLGDVQPEIAALSDTVVASTSGTDGEGVWQWIVMAGGLVAGAPVSDIYAAFVRESEEGFWYWGSLASERVRHAVTAIPSIRSGRGIAMVLVTGGLGPEGAVLDDAGVDRYSAEVLCADVFAAGEACQWPVGAGAMRRPRYAHRASPLPDGTVLISGGYDETGEPLDVLELFNPYSDCGNEILPED